MRRALGRLRRSAFVESAATFFALNQRRARQRLRGRFVRGIWLRTADYLAAHPDRGTFHPLPVTSYKIPAPTFVPDTPAAPLGGSIVIHRHALGFARLTRPWVVGHSGAVIGSDRRLLWDLSYEWPGRPQSHTTYHLPPLDVPELPGVTFTLAAMAAEKNYFHFLLNSLARLAYVARLSLPLAPDRYLVSGEPHAFVLDALALFGIARDRIVGTAGQPALRPHTLLAPPLVHHPFVVPREVCDFLYQQIVGSRPPPLRRHRLFIDRSDAPTRRIVNLDELRPAFADFDVEPLHLTGRSLAEQAALFHDAELIVANHGAALANLVFCNPGTRVIQILAPGMMEREYRAISHHRDLRHDYLVADFSSPADARRPRKDRDLILPPDRLRRALAATP
jgi:Capsular polysaccharide biosynthesis protein